MRTIDGRHHGRCLATLAALSCAACASGNLYDLDHRYEQGWRQGIVGQVGAASSIKLEGALQDCRTTAAAEQRFAVVWYRSNHAMRALILPLAVGEEPRPKSWVLVRPGSCSPPAAGSPAQRTSARVLEPAHS